MEQLTLFDRGYSPSTDARDRMALFDAWREANPDALREMEQLALFIHSQGKQVRGQFLVEHERTLGKARLVGIPYTDGNGVERCYGINNTDVAIISRLLNLRHPELGIPTRKSEYDGLVVA